MRARHRDHYTALAAFLDAPARRPTTSTSSGGKRHRQSPSGFRLEPRQRRCRAGTATGVGAVQPFWLTRGRVLEGLAWFGAVLDRPILVPTDVTPTTYAQAVADLTLITAMIGAPGDLDVPERALAIAREGDDPGLLLRALIACGYTAAFTADVARPYLDEAAGLARQSGDRWRLSQIRWSQAYTAIPDGDPGGDRRRGGRP